MVQPLRAAAIGAVLLLGCGHKGQDSAASASSAAAPASAPATDHLAPGELVEGKERAFGLPLPRDLRLQRSFAAVVFASGPLNASDVANFVRARVRDGTVSVGAAATVFDGVRVPSDAARVLYIRVMSGPAGEGARLEVRDVTPPPAIDLPDNAARMKAVGLTPDGKLADPRHLE